MVVFTPISVQFVVLDFLGGIIYQSIGGITLHQLGPKVSDPCILNAAVSENAYSQQRLC